ncbi:MAG: hypothetical protein ACPL1K_01410, partial [Candidatus Kryptoniota bacterium]
HLWIVDEMDRRGMQHHDRDDLDKETCQLRKWLSEESEETEENIWLERREAYGEWDDEEDVPAD